MVRRVGFLGFPDVSGPYSLFSQLRPSLLKYGVELRWFAAANDPHRGYVKEDWTNERQYGDFVGTENDGDESAGRKLVDHLQRENFDVVFVNVLSTPLPMNACRYLAGDGRRIMIVHSTSRGTYQAARAMSPFVDHTVCVSPRIQTDLGIRYRIDATRSCVIPNGYSNLFDSPQSQRTIPSLPLRILSLGRIDDSSKGVFWIPEILKHFPAEQYRLTIAGDGPDREKLRLLCGKHRIAADFVGRVGPEKACELFDSHDVMLFPSRFEGFGITLAESMRRGCVPIASKIRGVTDFIIDDGKSGFLFPVGDTRAASQIIRRLISGPAEVLDCSERAIQRAKERFSPDLIAEAYAKLLSTTLGAPRSSMCTDLNVWSYPRAFKPGFGSRFPAPVKAWLRGIASRF